MRITGVTIFVVLATMCCFVAISETGVVDYPSNYRSWRHVKTAILQPGHPLEDTFGGMHHIYANAKAMTGLTGGKYEEGAVFVFDLLDYHTSDNAIAEGNRKRIDVMQFDSQQFSATGGWGFESFVGDSKTERLDQDVVTACFRCHEPQKESNYVYSRYRP